MPDSSKLSLKKRISVDAFLKETVGMAFRSPSDRKDYRMRNRIKKTRPIQWWLVYGAARTGTTYMIDMITSCSRLWISDWCLDNMLKMVPDFDYIIFDKERMLKDISENIIDNAYWGQGDQLDFAVKEAELNFEEYQMMVKMWGKPSRIIYCFREPAGYISSAEKHFTGTYSNSLSRLQENYVRLFDDYEKIRGDIFEYTAARTMENYMSFLKPLNVHKDMNKEFVFKGSDNNEYVTDAMREAYDRFKKSHAGELK
jgi:hypothetical protein